MINAFRPPGAFQHVESNTVRIEEHFHTATVIEPVHIGAPTSPLGRGSIVRDLDGVPFIPASSLRGCCRALSYYEYSLKGCDGKGRECPQPHKCASCAVYGYLNFHSSSESVSLVRFSHAHVVLCPINLEDELVWITSPCSLSAAHIIEEQYVDVIDRDSRLGSVYIGHEIALETLRRLLQKISATSSRPETFRIPLNPELPKDVRQTLSRTITLSEAARVALLRKAIGTWSGISLESTSSRPRAGALFAMEFIVPKSIISFSITYTDPTIRGSRKFLRERDQVREEFDATIDALQRITWSGLDRMRVFGVGGNRSRGFGRIHVHGPHLRQVLSGTQQKETALPQSPSIVFISYAHEDATWARKLTSSLQSEGVDIWLDEIRMSIGDSIEAKIKEGLSISTFVIVLLSDAASRSEWVKSEVSLAVELEQRGVVTRVLPVVLDDTGEKEIPLRLHGRIWADGRHGLARVVANLMNTIQLNLRMVQDGTNL